MPIRRTRLPRSTIGEEIRNENVTPSGRPALVNPMKIGIEEQEQNGVTVPSSAPIRLAQTPWNLPMIRLLRSGGKKLCIYEIKKISTQSRIVILMTSYRKNCMLPPTLPDKSSPMADSARPTSRFSHFSPRISF